MSWVRGVRWRSDRPAVCPVDAARPWRRGFVAVMVAALMVAVAALAWLRHTSPAPTGEMTVSGSVGSMRIARAYVLRGATGCGHVEAVVRNAGDTQDRLLTAALGTTTAGRAQPSTLPATVTAHGSVDLGRLTGHGLLCVHDERGAPAVPVTFTFADAGALTMRLPIEGDR